MSWVSDSYYARFGNFPPVLYWRGTVKGLQALMMQALERGTPYIIINRGVSEHDDHPSVTLRLDGDVTCIVPPAVEAALGLRSFSAGRFIAENPA